VSFIVWQHHGKPWPRAVGHFAERELADAYAAYLNRNSHAQWSEVRRHQGDD
jgi:hypothetical protein